MKLDNQMEDLFNLLLAGRISYLSKKRYEEKTEEITEEEKKIEEWIQYIKEHFPELKKKSEDFLDWLIASQGKEIEDFYILGIKDAFQLMRVLFAG